MKADNRRVYLFIALGLIAAVFVGVAVWHTGSPSNPSRSDTATATPEVSTVAEASKTTTATPTSEEESTEKKPHNVATPVEGDPFLPPHAVVQQNPQPIVPTTVYRPPNVHAPTGQLDPSGPSIGDEPSTEPSLGPETSVTPESTSPWIPPETSAPATPSDTPDAPQAPQFTEPAPAPAEPAEAEPERAGMPPATGVPRQPLPWPFNLWF